MLPLAIAARLCYDGNMTTQAWSVRTPDGTTTWFANRAEADAFAATQGLASASTVRPIRAPLYRTARYGTELTTDRRSENLARGLREAFTLVEDGQAFDPLWALEIIADAVAQCGFAEPALTMSRAMFEACYEKLIEAGLVVPDPFGLPERATKFGELFGLALLVAALEPTPQLAYTDPASGERFVVNLPSIAGQM